MLQNTNVAKAQRLWTTEKGDTKRVTDQRKMNELPFGVSAVSKDKKTTFRPVFLKT